MYNYTILILLFLIINWLNLIKCHPIEHPAKQKSSNTKKSKSNSIEKEEKIQLELFSQLVSTHWQFEHLDSIMSSSHKDVANQIQSHIQIDTQPKNSALPIQMVFSQNQHHSSPVMIEDMEYDILKSQMMNAIQARTQELLPEVWDQLGDALGRPSMEQFIQQLVKKTCLKTTIQTDHSKKSVSKNTEESRIQDPTTMIVKKNKKKNDRNDKKSNNNNKNTNHQEVSYKCIQENAKLLSNQLDDYVQHHLKKIWYDMEQDILPDLLAKTTKELDQVVSYFNEAFHTHHLVLKVSPWSTSNIHPPLFLTSSSLEDHSLFSNFISLAKA
ncbi:unnamed protein product [Cunninghamella blakesleeana]